MAEPVSPLTAKLLVPLDGSPAAEAVLPAANALAHRLPAAVSLLHVIERDAPRRVHGERHLSNEAEAETYLRDVAARLEKDGVATSWHVHVVPVGDVPLSIASHAAEEEADFILLCVHGDGFPRSVLSGVVAQGVIQHAAPPVLLQRADARRPATFAPQAVTVAIDSNRHGEAAVPPASRLAHALGVPLHLLIVTPTVETLPGDEAAAARLIPSGAAVALDAEASVARDFLVDLAGRLRQIAPDVPVTTEVARGDPVQAIMTSLRAHPGVLALATHGRSGLNAFWAGSIGARLIARGSGPFLLVHPEPSQAPS
jgi:nucleotide-binding universal stress UspA family protein